MAIILDLSNGEINGVVIMHGSNKYKPYKRDFEEFRGDKRYIWKRVRAKIKAVLRKKKFDKVFERVSGWIQ